MNKYEALVKQLSARDILADFPEVIPLENVSGLSSASSEGATQGEEDVFDGHDSEQIKLMAENCIVLDYNDNQVGSGTKKLCHLMTNIDKGLLHRAFSVFLFDDQNRLLLQQRASEKITFADMWTNTCCSHPLCVDSEMGATFPAAVQGVKVAAQRKLDHELGIPAKDVPLEDFKFLSRIHYMAPSNGPWGEHEIDYILVIKANATVAPNPNEVRDIVYVSQDELRAMFADPNLKFTPWFRLICDSLLFKWWDQLETLEESRDPEIKRMFV